MVKTLRIGRRLLTLGRRAGARRVPRVAGDRLDEDVLERPVARQVRDLVLDHDVPLVDDDHLVTDLRHLGEDVRREDDRALAAEGPDEAPDLDDLSRIEADGGLVEEDRKSTRLNS